ncbi:response regulator transcription factor [Aliikangiella sp. G2MR2-5]|uniref:response regulator transcription factor n=1 Tax=Aliikangiella sp. G2MR2-5 TaxID=2788943 RepID=UPI0018AC708B|nr:response regulator transcription factor [Aliikangiella sp. G2MR2-5]
MIVLVVEDDIDLSELIAEFLESESIECDTAFNGVMGLELIRRNSYDVIILDLNLPRLDGLSLCSECRNNGISTPILMLTARDTIDDKIKGFESGSDDYLVKPFELKELLVRVKALSRRYINPSNQLTVDDLFINTATHQAFRNEKLLTLSPNEWKVLEFLMRNSPRVVPRSQLETLIWPDGEPSTNALKTLIYRLRKIIDNNSDRPLIHTIRGAGITLRSSDESKN